MEIWKQTNKKKISLTIVQVWGVDIEKSIEHLCRRIIIRLALMEGYTTRFVLMEV